MNKRVILNVEGDAGTHFALRALFGRICPDVDLIQAQDGEQAIRTIQSIANDRDLRLDFVIMHVSLPMRTGWEVLRVIRTIELYANVPVIMFTGTARESDRLRSEALNAEYLEKPSNLTDLTKVVHDTCERLGYLRPAN